MSGTLVSGTSVVSRALLSNSPASGFRLAALPNGVGYHNYCCRGPWAKWRWPQVLAVGLGGPRVTSPPIAPRPEGPTVLVSLPTPSRAAVRQALEPAAPTVPNVELAACHVSSSTHHPYLLTPVPTPPPAGSTPLPSHSPRVKLASGQAPQLVTLTKAAVTRADTQGGGGVLHVLDGVLLPLRAAVLAGLFAGQPVNVTAEPGSLLAAMDNTPSTSVLAVGGNILIN